MKGGRFAPRDWQPDDCPKCGNRQRVAYQPAADNHFVACGNRNCGHHESVPQAVLDMEVDGEGYMTAPPEFGRRC
jgi:ssDNA-binding Zn-finger/Zn-ribbon topoisomerase 1